MTQKIENIDYVLLIKKNEWLINYLKTTYKNAFNDVSHVHNEKMCDLLDKLHNERKKYFL